MRSTSLMLAAAMAIGATAASAASMSTVNINFTSSLATFTGNTSFAAFDSDIGTLLSATFDVDAVFGTSGDAVNTSPDPVDGSVTQVGFMSISGPLALTGIQGATGTQNFTVPGNDSVPYNVETSFSLSGAFSNLNDVQAPGGGPVLVGVTYQTAATPGGDFGSGTLSFNPSATITGTVTYEFERDTPEIPVPAALPLLATAIGGFGLMRRYRKS